MNCPGRLQEETIPFVTREKSPMRRRRLSPILRFKRELAHPVMELRCRLPCSRPRMLLGRSAKGNLDGHASGDQVKQRIIWSTHVCYRL